MDYKKKYEAALARARELHSEEASDESIDACEYIFPELAESEDERIRKWLVDYFTEIGENWIHREFTCEQIVAYLEKQKEQNSPDSTGLYYYDGKKFTCCGFPYNFTMNQQEEQKTVAISENNNSDTNGHLTGKILVEYGAHAKVRDGKRHCEMDWKEFQRLAHYFYELGKTEQKPAEWSEEDEDMLNSCISSIEEAKENRYAYKETDGDTSYDHEIEWLKSLRPHWKPSEEQMAALSDTLEFMPDTFKPRCTLVTLQNDLKKLI